MSTNQERTEWLGWRKKGIGSSDSAILWNKSPYKNRYDLFLDKTSTEEPKESGNFATQRGQELEPIIRKRWATIASLDLGIDSDWPALNVDQGNKVMRCSLDGYALTGDGQIIAEFKFQGKEAHLNIAKGIIPDHYSIQVQHQLLVTGAKKAYLVSYNDELDTVLYLEILPDQTFHNEHIRKCKAFWKEVLDKTPSAETLSFKKEIKTESDIDLLDIAKNYVNTSMQIKNLENSLEQMKKQLIAANGTADKTDFTYVTVIKSSRAGSVDYSKIEALKGIDLEPYRKPSTEYFLFKVK